MGVETQNYSIVGIDIDTTGRRLIDEIVQLAAYTKDSQFSQYIMPYMNLNPAARQRHQIKVVTIGFYRMLKSTQSFKILKSKSEVATLKDFLDWIENLKKTNQSSNGVILIFHEERKFLPYMLLEAFKRYGLLDRFFETVKSFMNGYELAKKKFENTDIIKSFNLRNLVKLLLNEKEFNLENGKKTNQLFEGNAAVRAKVIYYLAQKLANENIKFPKSEIAMENNNVEEEEVLKIITEFSQPIEIDLSQLDAQNKNIERQSSYRPIFFQYFKSNLYNRVKAVKFRIVLSENCYDAEDLKAVWNEKRKEGLAEVIQPLNNLKTDEKTELIDLLEAHFDPNKDPLKPILKSRSKRRTRKNRNKKNESTKEVKGLKKETGAGGDEKNIQHSHLNPVTIKINDIPIQAGN